MKIQSQQHKAIDKDCGFEYMYCIGQIGTDHSLNSFLLSNQCIDKLVIGVTALNVVAWLHISESKGVKKGLYLNRPVNMQCKLSKFGSHVLKLGYNKSTIDLIHLFHKSINPDPFCIKMLIVDPFDQRIGNN